MEEISSIKNDERKLAHEGIDIPIQITLNGHSMEPFIKYQKDTVTIIPINKNIKCGDIVLFQRNDGQYVVHRVFKIKESKVQTLGDGCLSPDAWIYRSNIVGKIIKIKKNKITVNTDTSLSRCFGIVWMKLLFIRNYYKYIRRIARNLVKRR